jgi:hypothetical protein
MSDFNYSIEDLTDTSSIARKTSNNFYGNLPTGEPVVTSFSQSGDASRSLTQRDLQSVLQLSNQSAQSSINGILGSISGADDKNIVIQDPNSSNPNAKLVRSCSFSSDSCQELFGFKLFTLWFKKLFC